MEAFCNNCKRKEIVEIKQLDKLHVKLIYPCGYVLIEHDYNE